jgi:hypothetical protein
MQQAWHCTLRKFYAAAKFRHVATMQPKARKKKKQVTMPCKMSGKCNNILAARIRTLAKRYTTEIVTN